MDSKDEYGKVCLKIINMLVYLESIDINHQDLTLHLQKHLDEDSALKGMFDERSTIEQIKKEGYYQILELVN